MSEELETAARSIREAASLLKEASMQKTASVEVDPALVKLYAQERLEHYLGGNNG